MDYTIVKGMVPPNGRYLRRDTLNAMLELADSMEIGDAAIIRQSEANTLRIVLAAKGFLCVTDGFRCPVRGRVYAFKLRAGEPELTYEI